MKRVLRGTILISVIGLLAGCTIFGTNKTPTVEPIPPAAPTLTLSASATDVKPGDDITLTGEVTGLGQPQFNLQLTSDGAPAIYTVLYNQSLEEQPPGDATHFVLLSAAATGNSVTYKLRALSAGTVSAGLSANGEAQGADGAFFQTNASSQPVTLNIAAPPARASISASSQEVGVAQTVTLDVASSGIGNVQYTVTVTDTADPANTASIVLGQAAADTPATSFMKIVSTQSNYTSGTDGTGTVVLETLGEGTVTASVSVNGEVQSGDPAVSTNSSVQSEPVTVSIVQPSITLTSSATEVEVGDQVTVTADVSGIASPMFILHIGNKGAAGLEEREFILKPGDPDLGPQEVDDRYQLQVVSTHVDGKQATFMFNTSSGGLAEVKVRANSGEGGLGPEDLPFQAVAINVGGQSQAAAYTVKPGDTLWSIARTAGTTMAAIVQLNVAQYPILATDLNILGAGWVLNLPGASDGSGGGGTGGPGGTTYTVKAGDNLFRIGLAYDLSWTVLAEANNLQPPYLLRPGDVLVIPAAP